MFLSCLYQDTCTQYLRSSHISTALLHSNFKCALQRLVCSAVCVCLLCTYYLHPITLILRDKALPPTLFYILSRVIYSLRI